MIAILAGSGQLPLDVYQSLSEKGTPFVIVKCDPEAEICPNTPVLHHHTQWGKVGAFMDFLQQHKVSQIVLAGAVSRPHNIADLKFDWKGLQWINSLRSAWSKGDDGLLRGVVELLEKEGFEVVAPHDLLAHTQIIHTHVRPHESDLISIETGKKLLTSLSPFDVGQSVIVAGEHVLGIEGPEGTDALIQRCAPFVGNKRAVLVKMAKVGQTLKVDKPTLGSKTISYLAEQGLVGVAFEKSTTHLIDGEDMVKLADSHNMFIHPF